jgi:hypothetical protein
VLPREGGDPLKCAAQRDLRVSLLSRRGVSGAGSHLENGFDQPLGSRRSDGRDAQDNAMSTTLRSAARPRSTSRFIVEPAVFAERLVSRDLLERIHLPEADLVGLRNVQTGETLYVCESGLQRWLQTCR